MTQTKYVQCNYTNILSPGYLLVATYVINAFWVTHVSNVRLSEPDTAWVHTTQNPASHCDLGSHIFWSSAKICQTMSNQINMPTILGYLMLSVLSNHPSLFFGVSGPVWPFQRPPFHLPPFSPSRNFEIFGRHRSFEINVWLVDGGGFHHQIIRWSWPTRSKRPRCPIHAVEIPRNSPWLLEWENHGSRWEICGKIPRISGDTSAMVFRHEAGHFLQAWRPVLCFGVQNFKDFVGRLEEKVFDFGGKSHGFLAGNHWDTKLLLVSRPLHHGASNHSCPLQPYHSCVFTPNISVAPKRHGRMCLFPW